MKQYRGRNFRKDLNKIDQAVELMAKLIMCGKPKPWVIYEANIKIGISVNTLNQAYNDALEHAKNLMAEHAKEKRESKKKKKQEKEIEILYKGRKRESFKFETDRLFIKPSEIRARDKRR